MRLADLVVGGHYYSQHYYNPRIKVTRIEVLDGDGRQRTEVYGRLVDPATGKDLDGHAEQTFAPRDLDSTWDHHVPVWERHHRADIAAGALVAALEHRHIDGTRRTGELLDPNRVYVELDPDGAQRIADLLTIPGPVLDRIASVLASTSSDVMIVHAVRELVAGTGRDTQAPAPEVDR